MGSFPISKAQHSADLLLLQNLLGCKLGTSPFTLVLDTINQPAFPLLEYFMRNAFASKSSVIYLSFETYPSPADVTYYIKGRRKTPSDLQQELSTLLGKDSSKRVLLIIDTLHPLCALPPPFSLALYLSSLLALFPALTLVAVYHLDVPLPISIQHSNLTRIALTAPTSPRFPRPNDRMKDTFSAPSLYQPTPMTTLSYLATTILTLQSFPQVLAQKRAYDRSRPAPLFGMEEEKDGILTPLLQEDPETSGFVLDIEHRRRSGRMGTVARFHLPVSFTSTEKPCMLDEHPSFRALSSTDTNNSDQEAARDRAHLDDKSGTFNLELTERQRRAREGVVLPYFDAQKAEGATEGGRILYDMGVEDDFDEEEDEI